MKRYYPEILMADQLVLFLTKWRSQIKETYEPQKPIEPTKPTEPENIIHEIGFAFIGLFIFSFLVSFLFMELPFYFSIKFTGLITITLGSYFSFKLFKENRDKRRIYKKGLEKYHLDKADFEITVVEFPKKLSEFKENLKEPEFRISLRKDLLHSLLSNSKPAKIEYQNTRRGTHEASFELKLNKWFGDTIMTNKVIKTFFNSSYDYLYSISDRDDIKERAYVPDFYFSHPVFNLNIDIELDEPYYTENSQFFPIHYCDNKHDIKRNQFFIENNWVVIRFSEEQIVRYPDSCCREIAELINDICFDNSYLEKLSDVPRLSRVEKWDEEDAMRLIKNKSRTDYSLPINNSNIHTSNLSGIWDNSDFQLKIEEGSITFYTKKSSIDKTIWTKIIGSYQLSEDKYQRLNWRITWKTKGVTLFLIDKITPEEFIFTTFYSKISRGFHKVLKDNE